VWSRSGNAGQTKRDCTRVAPDTLSGERPRLLHPNVLVMFRKPPSYQPATPLAERRD
jgi:hypothetical protein